MYKLGDLLKALALDILLLELEGETECQKQS